MGYVYSTPFFCMSTETISDMANTSMGDCHRALPHPLKKLEDTPSPEERAPGQDDD